MALQRRAIKYMQVKSSIHASNAMRQPLHIKVIVGENAMMFPESYRCWLRGITGIFQIIIRTTRPGWDIELVVVVANHNASGICWYETPLGVLWLGRLPPGSWVQP